MTLEFFFLFFSFLFIFFVSMSMNYAQWIEWKLYFQIDLFVYILNANENALAKKWKILFAFENFGFFGLSILEKEAFLQISWLACIRKMKFLWLKIEKSRKIDSNMLKHIKKTFTNI